MPHLDCNFRNEPKPPHWSAWETAAMVAFVSVTIGLLILIGIASTGCASVVGPPSVPGQPPPMVLANPPATN